MTTKISRLRFAGVSAASAVITLAAPALAGTGFWPDEAPARATLTEASEASGPTSGTGGSGPAALETGFWPDSRPIQDRRLADTGAAPASAEAETPATGHWPDAPAQ